MNVRMCVSVRECVYIRDRVNLCVGGGWVVEFQRVREMVCVWLWTCVKVCTCTRRNTTNQTKSSKQLGFRAAPVLKCAHTSESGEA